MTSRQLAQNQSPPGADVMLMHCMWNHLITQFGLSHKIILPNDVRRHTHQIVGGMWLFCMVLMRLAVRLAGFAQEVVALRVIIRFGSVETGGKEKPMIFKARVKARVTEINNEIKVNNTYESLFRRYQMNNIIK